MQGGVICQEWNSYILTGYSGGFLAWSSLVGGLPEGETGITDDNGNYFCIPSHHS